ncbi:hypothetical protein Dimus_023052, partial [Dionaea muscipula]
LLISFSLWLYNMSATFSVVDLLSATISQPLILSSSAASPSAASLSIAFHSLSPSPFALLFVSLLLPLYSQSILNTKSSDSGYEQGKTEAKIRPKFRRVGAEEDDDGGLFSIRLVSNSVIVSYSWNSCAFST